MKLKLTSCIAFAFVVGMNAQAVLVLDQSQTDMDHGYFLSTGVTRWQEFKPTLSGLEQIDVLLQRGSTGTYGDVNIELRDEVGLIVWSSVLNDESIPVGLHWVTIDTPLLPLVPENVYQIQLTGTWSTWPSGEALAWMGAHASTYDRGVSDVALSIPDEYDYAFKTYAIPEPASLSLLGLISGGIYFVRRFFVA